MVLKRTVLPNQLPVLRAERGASQMDVAKAVGMGHNRYWRIENGHTDPTDLERRTLAKTFGVSVSAIWPAAAA